MGHTTSMPTASASKTCWVWKGPTTHKLSRPQQLLLWKQTSPSSYRLLGTSCSSSCPAMGDAQRCSAERLPGAAKGAGFWRPVAALTVPLPKRSVWRLYIYKRLPQPQPLATYTGSLLLLQSHLSLSAKVLPCVWLHVSIQTSFSETIHKRRCQR